ncbi:ArgR family transcriptional regulator [Weissella coleopterorum]|uniref:Arginine repressor n=1 Tax=Weissella coleopterorum TaxID=2714949 RepID=A0A6G8B021_9LACO|nr:ArgR family transcriptional regulator [Weissella coleopterorum]QIL50473.1 ArgR family transcriptional regulator [Weissella coleopterorum]
MALKKKARQTLILEILAQQVIDSQEELMQALQQMGYEVTQATISRDIKELRVVRRADQHGQNRYQVLPDNVETTPSLVIEGVQAMATAATQVEFMISIKTTPGSGNRLAALMDANQIDEVVSTIAGHDTIHVLCKSRTAADQLINKLITWIE